MIKIYLIVGYQSIGISDSIYTYVSKDEYTDFTKANIGATQVMQILMRKIKKDGFILCNKSLKEDDNLDLSLNYDFIASIYLSKYEIA